MNKAIFIGELTLNITLPAAGETTAVTRIGDRTVRAAMLLGKMGIDTLFIGEAGADPVGDHIIAALDAAQVDTKSVDRFSEGKSSVMIHPSGEQDGTPASLLHTAAPAEPTDPVWPRFNEGDITVYGSFMALDKRNHTRVIELVDHAKARKGETVYLPYFAPAQVSRVTRVMPEVWECLEHATQVIATVEDLATLFPGEDPATAFHDHILFYCPRCLVLDYDNLTMHFFDRDRSWTRKCHPTDNDRSHWVSGAIAGAVRALAEGMRDPDDIMNTSNETAHSEIAH